MSKKRSRIAVDLDGTLAEYTQWDGSIGRPIKPMVDRVKQWLEDGKDVWIFTARLSHPNIEDWMEDAIEEWCLDNIGQVLPMTCIKDYRFEEFWDDRAVSVEPNTGRVLTEGRE